MTRKQQQSYWKSLEDAAREVASWPAWKRGDNQGRKNPKKGTAKRAVKAVRP